MGLREEKQARQRSAIMENAVALFRADGFEAVTVRDIAARSQLSEATFFNYFGSKDAVLCEWARRALEPAFAAAAAAPGPLRRNVRRLAEAIASLVAADEPLMREAWRRQRIVADERAARGRAAAPPGAEQLFAAARERGEVRADVPAEQIAELLRAGLEAALAHWLSGDMPPAGAPSPEPLARRLARAADLVLDASRKRNERVRPTPPAPGPGATRAAPGPAR